MIGCDSNDAVIDTAESRGLERPDGARPAVIRSTHSSRLDTIALARGVRFAWSSTYPVLSFTRKNSRPRPTTSSRDLEPSCPGSWPMSRSEFEEKNRLLLAGEVDLLDADLFAWKRGRDWLARQIAHTSEGQARRSPRLQLALAAHVGGLGRAVTEDVGLEGMRLLPDNVPRLNSGCGLSVRLNLVGRTVIVLGSVVWTDRGRIGLALDATHQADELALQAVVCDGLLHRWGESGG